MLSKVSLAHIVVRSRWGSKYVWLPTLNSKALVLAYRMWPLINLLQISVWVQSHATKVSYSLNLPWMAFIKRHFVKTLISTAAKENFFALASRSYTFVAEMPDFRACFCHIEWGCHVKVPALSCQILRRLVCDQADFIVSRCLSL